MPISKTDFVRGLQCEKMLWLDAHAPELKIIPPEVQARLDAGNAFGDDTMGIFGEYVETTAYKADGRLDYAKMLQTTQDLLEKTALSFARRRFRGTAIIARWIYSKKTATGMPCTK